MPSPLAAPFYNELIMVSLGHYGNRPGSSTHPEWSAGQRDHLPDPPIQPRHFHAAEDRVTASLKQEVYYEVFFSPHASAVVWAAGSSGRSAQPPWGRGCFNCRRGRIRVGIGEDDGGWEIGINDEFRAHSTKNKDPTTPVTMELRG